MRFRVLAALIVMMLAVSTSVVAQQAWGKSEVKEGWGDAPGAKKKAPPVETPAAAKKKPVASAKAPAPSAAVPKTTATAPAAQPDAASAATHDAAESTPSTTPATADAAVTPAAAPVPNGSGSPAPGILVPPVPAAPPAQAPASPIARAAAPSRSAPATRRWLDLQTATAAVRQREIETSAGVLSTNQMQTRENVKGRVKIDAAGSYSVNLGIATGTSITGGWNTTGVGTGPGITNMYVKQFYFSGVPTRGVELQYGGIAPIRGDNTEVTSYDDDVYLAGERASIKRPKQLFFDEVSLTQAYLGDATTPNFFKRYERLAESNYHQVLFGKKIGKPFSASVDYTRVSGVGTMRAAFAYRRPLIVVDTVRFEQYRRLGAAGAYGYSVYGEKAFGTLALVGTGWASIDPQYGGLNGDRYNKGRRLFMNATLTLSPELALSAFYTHALANDYPVANGTRFDFILTYNVLKTLQRAGLF